MNSESRMPLHNTSVIEGMLDTLRTGDHGLLTSGNHLGKYQVLRLLGCHGQATVALANDPDLSRLVVLKLYHFGENGQHRQRILNEGRALASLNSNYVTTCHSIEEHDDLLVLVLEYIDGMSLEEFIEEHQLSVGQKLEILAKITRGVSDVHKANLLHRDLKSSNVMVTTNGEIKLIDFGLVATSQELDRDPSGTPAYMSPERAKGENQLVDERSDIFGIGAIFYDMLTGKPPFDAESKSASRALAIAGIITPPCQVDPEIPARLSELCMKCVATRMEDRFSSVGKLQQEIDQLIGSVSEKSPKQFLIGVLGLMLVGCILIYVGWAVSDRDSADTSRSENLASIVHPRDFYPDLDRLEQINNEHRDALIDGDVELARSLVLEAIEIAQQEDMRPVFLAEVQALKKETEKWESLTFEEQQSCGQALSVLAVARTSSSQNEKLNSAIETLTDTFGKASVLGIKARSVGIFRASRDQRLRDCQSQALAVVTDCREAYGDSSNLTFQARKRYSLACQYLSEDNLAADATRASLSFTESGPPCCVRLGLDSALRLVQITDSHGNPVGQETLDHMATADRLYDQLPRGSKTPTAVMDRTMYLIRKQWITRKLGDLDEAKVFGQEALATAELLPDSDLKSDRILIVLQELAVCCGESGDVSDARKYVARILKTRKEKDGEKSQSYMLANFTAANTFKAIDRDLALHYARTALALELEISDEVSPNRYLLHNAIVALSPRDQVANEQKRADGILELLRPNLPDETLVAFLLNNAEFSNGIGNLERAVEKLNEAKQLIEKNLALTPKDDYNRKAWDDRFDEWERVDGLLDSREESIEPVNGTPD